LLHLAHPFLILRTPERDFDIHVLQTFTNELNRWIVRLQPPTGPAPANETINQVIYALNNTYRDVERQYRVWRNDRIQTILQHGKIFFFFFTYQRRTESYPVPRVGFTYARTRIEAALWRRERGRPPATFPAIYPAYNFSGVMNPSLERQHRSDGSYYQPMTYPPAGPSTASWGSPQPQAAQHYPIQNNTYPGRSVSAAPAPVAVYPQGFGQEAVTGRVNDHPRPHVDYPPPPYPPPAQWRPPDPVPGSPPIPAEAGMAEEVAIRYLEAVNKAISICIEFGAM